MPPLLSSKVRRLARLLADRQQQADAQLTQAGKEDRWAAIVFVETKVSVGGLSAAECCQRALQRQLQIDPHSRQLQYGQLVGMAASHAGHFHSTVTQAYASHCAVQPTACASATPLERPIMRPALAARRQTAMLKLMAF